MSVINNILHSGLLDPPGKGKTKRHHTPCLILHSYNSENKNPDYNNYWKLLLKINLEPR